MNSPELHKKVTGDAGRAARLASQSPRAIVEELYLLTYSRFPTEEEQSCLRVTLRGRQGRPSARGRRPALGTAELARIHLQGLIVVTWRFIASSGI